MEHILHYYDMVKISYSSYNSAICGPYPDWQRPAAIKPEICTYRFFHFADPQVFYNILKKTLTWRGVHIPNSNNFINHGFKLLIPVHIKTVIEITKIDLTFTPYSKLNLTSNVHTHTSIQYESLPQPIY